jgi:hypothetical protein
MTTERVPVAAIEPGDTVLIDGVARTVCRRDLARDSFFPARVFGQHFHEAGRTVERVLFPVWFRGKLIRHAAQIGAGTASE